MAQYICGVCQFVFNENFEEKKWDELPNDWFCPFCSASKSDFKKLEE